MFYHYSQHPFEPGDIVEARVSFPFPDAWAWAGRIPPEVGPEFSIYCVEPLGEVEQSPFHEWAVRSKDGFRVISRL